VRHGSYVAAISMQRKIEYLRFETIDVQRVQPLEGSTNDDLRLLDRNLSAVLADFVKVLSERVAS
jgi:hypothetical protein